MLPVIFRPLADADAVAAKAWYAGYSPEAADHFVDALAEVVSLISEYPQAFQLVAEQLEAYTDQAHTASPLTERSEILLGLRPYSRTNGTGE